MAVPDFEVIEGKYEILDKLREGGMGAVYKVRHRLLDELRVVKVIRPQLEGDEKLRERFLREARAAVQLRHPNIATLHDFTIDDDGVAFMVMEFINGEDLKRVVARHRRLPVALGLEVALQTLRALQYLHSRGFIHRDIAPDNLMLCRDPEERVLVKLIDLGVAKSLDSTEELTRDGMFVGKYRYGAPEQFGGAGLEVDARTDLYSLGVVMYEILTGSHPFPGENEREIVGGHLFHAPRDFEETDPDRRLPEALRAAILRALEKTPEDRFQQAEELGIALREIQDGWEATEDEVIELVTTGEGGEGDASHTSTQRRLDHQFAPDVTPPPIADLGVVERTDADRTAIQPRAPAAGWGRKRTLLIAGALLVLVAAWIVYQVAGREDGGAAADSDLEESSSPVSDGDAAPVAEPPSAPAVQSADAPAGGQPDVADAFDVPTPTPPAAPASAPADPEPSAPAPRTGPSAAERRAAELVETARALYRAGNDRQAFESVRDALELAPRSDGARRLLGDLVASAESRAVRARREAEASAAATKAAAELERARVAERAAAEHRAAGRLESAVTGYWSAADLFAAAARRAEEVVSQERQAAARAEAERVAAAEAAAQEPRAAPEARPAPAVDPTPSILGTLQAFARAHEALDIVAVRALWPTLSGSRLDALTSSFAGARDIDMTISGCAIEADGSRATARCALSQSYRPKRGTRQSIERRVTVELIRRGDRWLIDDYS